MAKKISIAIDGPAGAGKSTIARRLAKELGYMYVDTGAIYRTVAYFFDLWGVSPKDIDGITRYIDELNVGIEYDEDGVQHMIMNGLDVTEDIRTPEISQKASIVSAHAIVRDMLLDMQRDVAKQHNVIMDGRDIGTVVLPRATVKIFLTASAEVRAKRRCDEMTAKGMKANYHWMEAVFGVDAKIAGPLRLGWSVRYRRRIAHDDGNIGKTWYVPGYGKQGGSRLGGTFNIIFEI